MLTDAQNSAVTQQSRNNIIMVVAIIAVMVIATIVVVVFAGKLIRSIAVPTEEVRNALVGFSEGNFDVEVEFESKNELGDMCEALRTSQQVLRALVDDECYLLEEMARGNFDIQSKMCIRDSDYPHGGRGPQSGRNLSDPGYCRSRPCLLQPRLEGDRSFVQ